MRGLAFVAAGDGYKAAEEFRKILSHPGLVGNYPLGALAQLGLARAYTLQAGIGAEEDCKAHSKECFQTRNPKRRQVFSDGAPGVCDLLS